MRGRRSPQAYPEVSPRAEYELGELGRALLDVSETLLGWTHRYAPEITSVRREYQERPVWSGRTGAPWEGRWASSAGARGLIQPQDSAGALSHGIDHGPYQDERHNERAGNDGAG